MPRIGSLLPALPHVCGRPHPCRPQPSQMMQLSNRVQMHATGDTSCFNFLKLLLIKTAQFHNAVFVRMLQTSRLLTDKSRCLWPALHQHVHRPPPT